MPTKAVKARESDMGQLLIQLTKLLKENGDDILQGNARFTLSARCLCHLTELCRQQEDSTENGTTSGGGPGISEKSTGDAVSEVLLNDAAFISNMVSRTPRVKIMHTGGPLNSAVKIMDFVGLRDLEIQRLPIHMLEGLKQLRNQLEHLSFAHSLQSLQEVLEVCGGDQSSPMTWPALRFLNVSFNEITALDASLRLLPQLETLNLSHNRIRVTERCLEYLTHLRHVNLGFNGLTAVPSFSLTTNSHLVTLGLAFNHLSGIQGVEALVGLEVLDLSGNCLMRHSSLKPLSHLNRLRMVRLLDNPFSQHKQHRQLVLMSISRFVDICQFRLDDRPLSKSEAQLCQCEIHWEKEGQQHQLVWGSPGSLSENPGGDGPQVTATSIQVGRIKPRKRRRPRRTLIADLDSSTTEVSSRESSRAPSPIANGATASSSTRREVERLRQHLGSLWLAAMSQGQSIPAAPTGGGALNSPRSTSYTPVASATPAALHRGLVLESNMQSSKTAEDLATGEREDPSQNDLFITETESHLRRRPTSQDGTLTDCVDGARCADPSRMVCSLQSQDHVKQEHQEQPVKLEQASRVLSLFPAIASPTNAGDNEHLSSAGQNCQNLLPQNLSAVEEASPLTPGDSGLEWFRTEEEEAEMYGDESEPFIVQTGQKGDTLLVSLNERYVLEKNLDGKVVERLDLTSLYAMSCPEREQEGVQGQGDLQDAMVQSGPQLSLKFDYIRKDRRHRLYIMEDEENLEKLQGLLQPFLEQRARVASLTTSFQCLVCSQEWEVKRRQPSKWSAGFPAGDLSDGEEGRSCPKCGSGQVIQLENSMSTSAPTSLPSSLPAASMPTMTEDAEEELNVLHSAAMGARPDPVATGSRRRSNAFLLSKDEDTLGSSLDRLDQGAGSSPRIHESVSRFAPRGLSFPNLQRGFFLEGRVGSSLQTRRKASLPQPHLQSCHSETLSRMEAVQPVGVSEQVGDARTFAGESSVQCQRLHSEDSDIAVLGAPSDTGQGSGDGEGGQGLGDREGGQPGTSGHLGSPVSVLDSVSQSLASSVLWNSLRNSPVIGDVPALSPSPTPPFANNTEILGNDTRDDEKENEEVSIYDMPGQKRVSFVWGTPSSPLEPQILPFIIGARETAGMEKCVDIEAHSSSFSGQERQQSSDLLGDIDILPDGELASCSGVQMGKLLHGKEQTQTSQSMAWRKLHTGPSAEEEEDDGIVALQSHSNLAAINSSVQEMAGLTGEAMGGEADRGQSQTDVAQATGCLSETSPFMQVDHHLKLFLLMSVFQDDEECLGAIRCDCVQYMMEKEFPGMLVISSSRIYILQVLSDQPSECPESWLKVVDAQPLGELRFVDPGLGHQSVRLEFNTELSCYTLILRDSQHTKTFLCYLEETMTHAAMQIKEQLNVIINEDPDAEAMDMIKTDVLAYSSTGDSLVAYLMGFVARGIQAKYPVSFVVSQEDVCLVRENHQYPLPRLQAPQDSATLRKRFTVLERRPISTVAGLTVDVKDPCRLRVAFCDEEAEEETSWLVAMVTESGQHQLAQALSASWEAMFGVAMEVTRSRVCWDEDYEETEGNCVTESFL